MNTSAFRPLCLSLRLPPETRPQAILIGKMVPEWIRQGVHPVIAGYRNGGAWHIDAPIHRLPHAFRIPFAGRSPFIAHIRDRLHAEALARRLITLVRQEHINVIFSFASPTLSNLVAATMRTRLSVPVVAHFSDPWHDSPFTRMTSEESREALAQERFVVETCDRLVFVSETLRRLVMRKYPAAWDAKAHVIPHCFDPREYPDAQPDPKHFTLTHAGVFYRKGRDPRVLFQAISALLTRRPELAERLRVDLLGSLNIYSGYTADELDELIRTFGLGPVVRVIPTVPYLESLERMKRSDCLLAIDLDIPNSPYLPSKIFDYLGAGRPLVGIMGDATPSAQVIRACGYRTFRFDQAKELSHHFEELIDGRAHLTPHDEVIRNFTVEATTKTLLALLHETAAI